MFQSPEAERSLRAQEQRKGRRGARMGDGAGCNDVGLRRHSEELNFVPGALGRYRRAFKINS